MSETPSAGGASPRRGDPAPLTVQETSAEKTPVQVSTGRLPDPEEVLEIVTAAHRSYASVDDGVVAHYIPALAQASPDLFGVAIAGVHGLGDGCGRDRRGDRRDRCRPAHGDAEQKARYTKMHDDTRLLKGEAHLDHQHEPVTDPAA